MSVFHFIGPSSPYLLFLWLAGVIPSFSWCLLWGQELFWCFLFFSSGRWVTGQPLPHSCLVLPSAWPGDRLGQRNYRDERGPWGWVTWGQKCDTNQCCTSSNCFILKSWWLCGKQIAYDSAGFADSCTSLNEAQADPRGLQWVHPLDAHSWEMSNPVCSSVLAGAEIATLCSELSMGEGVTRLTVKWCFREIN